jgi:hypothetical protein
VRFNFFWKNEVESFGTWIYEAIRDDEGHISSLIKLA